MPPPIDLSPELRSVQPSRWQAIRLRVHLPRTVLGSLALVAGAGIAGLLIAVGFFGLGRDHRVTIFTPANSISPCDSFGAGGRFLSQARNGSLALAAYGTNVYPSTGQARYWSTEVSTSSLDERLDFLVAIRNTQRAAQGRVAVEIGSDAGPYASHSVVLLKASHPGGVAIEPAEARPSVVEIGDLGPGEGAILCFSLTPDSTSSSPASVTIRARSATAESGAAEIKLHLGELMGD
jgi:hypothetical protein